MIPVRSLIRQYNLDPKRSLGQNFLIDESHLDRIIAAADLHQDDSVLEIGPGLGGLTQRLLMEASRVVAVELDDRLIELLKGQFALQPHLSIVHADILTVEPWTLFSTDVPNQPAPYKVVANLPYYITSAVLRHLLEADHSPTSAVVMVQKEVAERICAAPGNLSILGVSIQFYAEPTLIHHLPSAAFYPRPKVDSAVLHLAVYPQPRLSNVTPDLFFRIVKAGFSQKRKQLLNSLSSALMLPKPAILDALDRSSIDPKRRAETLSLDEWGQLYNELLEPLST